MTTTPTGPVTKDMVNAAYDVWSGMLKVYRKPPLPSTITVRNMLEAAMSAVTADAETCYRCHGKGRTMLGAICTRCDGQGVEPEGGEEAAPKTALDALYRDAQSWARHFAPCVEDDNNWYRGESSIDGKDAAEIGELFAETVRLIPLLKSAIAIANATEDE